MGLWFLVSLAPSPVPPRCSGPTSPPHGGGEVFTLPLRVALRWRRSNTSPPPCGGEVARTLRVLGRVRGCCCHIPLPHPKAPLPNVAHFPLVVCRRATAA